MKHTIHTTILPSEILSASRELFNSNRGQYLEYISQVFWWNKRVNLISRDVSHETMVKHVQHSLLLAGVEEVVNADKILDTGSGGGLPGVPLSIAMPDKIITANDIVSKKMMAVKQIARKMGCDNFNTVTGSIGEYDLDGDELIVSKHAFKIGELIDHLGDKSWSRIVFLKGEKEAYDEIRDVDLPLKVDIIELEEALEDSFYKGKAIVKIVRKDEKL